MKPKKGAGFVCEHGCDQLAYFKANGTGCPHLEALIGNTRTGEFRPDRVEQKIEYSKILTPEEEFEKEDEELFDDELNLRYNLTKMGISKKAIEVVILRLVRGYTFKEIADELRYKNRNGPQMMYVRVIDKLKLNGYGRG